MKPLKAFDIQFVGLKLGLHQYEYKIEQTFFELFEFEEYNSVDVKITIQLEKKATLLELHFLAEGFVNVNCDVTNEPYSQAIQSDFSLVVKFGPEYNDDNESILVIPHGAYKINAAQYIYELIVLAVPQKRLHPGVEDGSLDSAILKTLEKFSLKGPREDNSDKDTDPRWDSLKKLLTDK